MREDPERQVGQATVHPVVDKLRHNQGEVGGVGVGGVAEKEGGKALHGLGVFAAGERYKYVIKIKLRPV